VGHKNELLWVRGHAGHVENERVDELARRAIEDNRRMP
jgi:ribonuclease HI